MMLSAIAKVALKACILAFSMWSETIICEIFTTLVHQKRLLHECSYFEASNALALRLLRVFHRV